MKRLSTLLFCSALLAACHESSANGPSDATGGATETATETASASATPLEEILAAVQANEVPKAERLCKEHLEAHPGDADVASALIDIYLQLGAGDLARERIEQTLAANPEACKMHFYSGLLHGRKGRLDQAGAAFQEAEACGFRSADLEFNLAVLDFNQGRNERSIERLRGLRETNPDWTQVRRELARGLLEEGSEASLLEAQELLDQLSVELPEDWRVWQLLGRHSEVQGDVLAAREYYTEALRAGKNPPEAEEDFRRVSQKMLDQGMGDLVPTKAKNEDLPPISAGMQERFDDARRHKAEAAAEAAADGETSGPPAPDSDGR